MRDGERLVATAALLPYSAGNAWISMVLVTADWRRRGIATQLVDACLDAAATARPHRLAGCDARRRRRLRPARLHADAAIAAAAAGEAARQPSDVPLPLSAGNLDALDRARCQRHGIRPQHVAVGICRDVRAPASCLHDRRHGPRPRRTHRASYRPAAAPIAPIRRSRWSTPSSRSETGPWLIDAVHSQEEFLQRPHPHRAGTSSGRFSACASAAPPVAPAQLPFAVAGPEFG